MASTPSGKVAQNNSAGSQLLYTDTGSYGNVSSRILNIYDCNGNLLVAYTMGSSLTQIYNITADGFSKFVCTVADDVSGSPWVTEVDYVAIGFYSVAYLNAFNGSNCGCSGNLCNLEIAELFLNASLRMNLAGNFIASNSLIIGANVYANLEQ